MSGKAKTRWLIAAFVVVGLCGGGVGLVMRVSKQLRADNDCRLIRLWAGAALGEWTAEQLAKPPEQRQDVSEFLKGKRLEQELRLHVPECPRSPAGDLIDPWGNPYYIDITEKNGFTEMKVGSPGPDGVKGNDDDCVRK